MRQHIALAGAQSIVYKPEMKEALAWWTREYIEGMRAEMHIPIDSATLRTILIFARATKAARPKMGEQFYFEIPSGIEQIESLKTEAHLFLFDTLPRTARDGYRRLMPAINALFRGLKTVREIGRLQPIGVLTWPLLPHWFQCRAGLFGR